MTLPDARGLHRIEEDLGQLVVDETTGEKCPDWFDWLGAAFEIDSEPGEVGSAFLAKQAAFAAFLRARGHDFPI